MYRLSIPQQDFSQHCRLQPALPRRAFTLIELLVVIAIVAILAAVLFPVFQRVRENARKTACLSNEKQLALGIALYTQDFDEFIPPTAVCAPDGVTVILWPALINSYVNNAQLRLCPSDSTDKLNSYGLNELNFVDETDAAVPTLSLAAFQTPANTVMLGELGVGKIGDLADITTPTLDAYKMTVPDTDMNDQYDARPSARHTSRANLAFMDGHVKSLRLEQFYTGQTPPDKWFCTNPENIADCHGN